MKYKLVSRKNPQKPDEQGKLYAAPVNDGKVSQREIAAEIVGLSSLSRGDVNNVIDCLIDTVPKYLLMGKSVSLGELGTLRITFSSEGVDTADEFTVGKIKGARVLFTPSPVLRQSIAGIKFEKEA
jgi:predicted histone-like DNA-binding protein